MKTPHQCFKRRRDLLEPYTFFATIFFDLLDQTKFCYHCILICWKQPSFLLPLSSWFLQRWPCRKLLGHSSDRLLPLLSTGVATEGAANHRRAFCCNAGSRLAWRGWRRSTRMPRGQQRRGGAAAAGGEEGRATPSLWERRGGHRRWSGGAGRAVAA